MMLCNFAKMGAKLALVGALLLPGCASGSNTRVQPEDAGQRAEDAAMDGSAQGEDAGTADSGPAADAGCVHNDQCPGELPVCNDANGECENFAPAQCSACGPDGGCEGDAVCYDDPASGTRYCAMPCVRALRCPDGYKCIDGPSARRLCVPEDNMCEGSPCEFVSCDEGLVCIDGLDGTQCVQCEKDADCTGGTTCDPATNTCVGCTEDSDCEGGRCDPDTNECVQCLGDEDCPTGRCNPETSNCVQCLEDADCSGNKGVCRPSSNSCVACLEDDDCAGDDVCNPDSLTCVECVDDGDCSGELRCSQDQCVETSECDSDAECPSGVCNALTGTCDCEPFEGQCKPAEVCCLGIPITCELPRDC
jgi:hypothetical protein